MCYTLRMPQVWGSAGGKARAITSREEALTKYYANPNRCLDCSAVIVVPPKSKVTEIRRKKFCNHVCAARYNNRHRLPRPHEGRCRLCGKVVPFKQSAKGSYVRRIYCDTCLPIGRNNSLGRKTMTFITKGQLFTSRKHWQSAANSIRCLARLAYMASKKPLACAVCGYDKHVDICHILRVSEFPDYALISEINSPDNLVALCPTHHWELDHGLNPLALPR